MLFIQRNGSVGNVPFTGDMARVLNTQGQVIVDWTTGGVLNGVPQGDGYTLEVMTGSTLKVQGLAVGAVVFTLGQSNIQRWFDGPTTVGTTAGTYAMSSDGKIGVPTGAAGRVFTNAYAAETGVPVLIVNAAKGGTALLQSSDKGNGYWLDTNAGSLYSNALSLLARTGGAEAVLWGQGETDASAKVTVAAYAAGLTTLMNRILADFNVATVLIQQIGPHGDGIKYDDVRTAQQQVADAMPGVIIGALANDLNTIEDGVHLSGASRALAADRMVDSALVLLGINVSRTVQTGSDDADLGDNLNGQAGRDELLGKAGNDTLDGGGGSDVVLGGAGNDTVIGGAGFDLLRGDAGDDFVDGGDDTDIISGGDGQDTLKGGDGDDELWGDLGDDDIEGGAGNDLIFGGGGTDTAVFAGRAADYLVTIAGSTITIRDLVVADGNDGTDTLIAIDFLRFSDGTVAPTGTTLPSLFTTSTDFVDFASITGGPYAPQSLYLAMAGDDEVYLPVDAAAAVAAGYDITQAFDAGPGDDVVIGGTLNDTIRGGDGDDLINGGAGLDRMEGGAGNDTYYVDSSGDTIIERAGEGIDTVISSFAGKLTLKSFVENLVLSGTADSSGSGNAENNRIIGNSGNNTLGGLSGNDELRGEGGDDRITGAEGDDLIDGGLGIDTAIYTEMRSALTFTLRSDGAIIVVGPTGTDTVTGIEFFRLAGTTFATSQLMVSEVALSGAIAAAEGNSGTTSFSYTVTRTGNTSGVSTVDWAVAGGTASAADFGGGVLPSGTVSFVAGQTTQTIVVQVAGDTVIEADEGFTLTLSNAVGTAITNASAAGTIRNDDAPPPSLALSGAIDAAEGNSGTTAFSYTVTRTGDASGISTAEWAVATGTASAVDFEGGVLPSGTVSFAAGQTTQTIMVQVAGDTVIEADEGFTLTLSNAVGATITTASAAGTIRNDDAPLPPPASLALSGAVVAAEGNSGTTAFSYTVTRTGDTSGVSTVDWAVASGMANATDFGGGLLPSGTVSFAAGETTQAIIVQVAGDTMVEGDEGFTLTLSNAVGATITAANAAGTIRNDDGGSVPTSGDDTLLGTSGNDRIDGLDGNDIIYGFAGVDVLFGGAGNDTLDGGIGSDSLSGGAGNDSYYADTPSDSIIERAGGGIDTVYYSGTSRLTLKPFVENLVMIGTGNAVASGNAENNVMTGNSGNNHLIGASGADTLDGGAGADIIEGGLGADFLVGGTGSDRFLFRTPADIGGGVNQLPSDRVDDFTQGDLLDFSKIDSNVATSTNNSFMFIGTAAFTATSQLRWFQDTSSGQTFVEGNINADLAADFLLAITGLHMLAATDFVL